MPEIKKITRLAFFAGLWFSSFVTLGIAGTYFYLAPKLPSIESLKDIRFQVPLRVYSSDSKLIAEFGEKKRVPIHYEDIPERVVQAVLAAEDDRFFEHPGVDYQGILRAVYTLMTTGVRAQGGSTITMQVARNFFLSRKKTFLRKLNEIFLSFKIERSLSKEEILELYLNKIYLGNRAYGVGAASHTYYGKPIQELSVAQMAMIAGLPKAPSSYNPIVNPERATLRRNYVLRRMFELGYISEEEFQENKNSMDNAVLSRTTVDVEADYLAEMVRAEVVGMLGEEAYTGGYSVYTTVSSRLQLAANASLRDALQAYDQRHGYRGVLAHVELPLEESMRGCAEGDVSCEEPGQIQECDPTLGAECPGTVVEVDPCIADPQSCIENEQLPVAADDCALIDHDLWAKTMRDYSRYGDLFPALVVCRSEKSVLTYQPKFGMVRIAWAGLSWAKPYISLNRVGDEPQKASDLLSIGDVIYLRQVKAGRWILAQAPEVSGALVSLSAQDGSVQALIGGYDYFQSKFNRVTQAQRQPGSNLKPFVYSAGLEKGYTAASLINDAPVVFEDPGLESTWRPENYSGKFFGPTRLRKALVKSRNLVSIRLLRSIGISYGIKYVQRFGFDPTHLPRDLSLALGSASVPPYELVAGYAVFANTGYRVEPYFIERIEGPDGLVYEADPLVVCPECEQMLAEHDLQEEARREQEEKALQEQQALNSEQFVVTEEVEEPAPVIASVEDELSGPVEGELLGDIDLVEEIPLDPMEKLREMRFAKRVITPQNAYIMTTMMQDVVRFGTGRSAKRALGRNDMSGKTGTTNDQQDAWFSGFAANVVTTAWVGFDKPQPLGDRETGARAALPMWISYMKQALRGVPERPLIQPEGLVSVKIDPVTGLLARAGNPDAIFEIFRSEHVPTQKSDPKSSNNSVMGEGLADPAEESYSEQLF